MATGGACHYREILYVVCSSKLVLQLERQWVLVYRTLSHPIYHWTYPTLDLLFNTSYTLQGIKKFFIWEKNLSCSSPAQAPQLVSLQRCSWNEWNAILYGGFAAAMSVGSIASLRAWAWVLPVQNVIAGNKGTLEIRAGHARVYELGWNTQFWRTSSIVCTSS